MVICHLVSRADWGTGAGDYRPASLASEGFIHFSTPEQVVATANRYYAGRDDLLMVVVDPDRLGAELRWEAPTVAAGSTGQADDAADSAAAPTDGELFPHLYGTFDANAVVTIVPFSPGPDGRFSSPPGLW